MATDDLLDRLASQGFAGVPASRLPEVIAAAEDDHRRAGDERFSIVADAFRRLLSWWDEHEKYGGVPRQLLDEIDELIRIRLPWVLRLTGPSDGARAASAFARELRDHELDRHDWVARGWVKEPGPPQEE